MGMEVIILRTYHQLIFLASVATKYYCNDLNIKEEYGSHLVLRHARKPRYPSKADLERLRMQHKVKDRKT